MSIEVEICVKLENHDEAKLRLEKAGKFIKTIHQIDIYLTPSHRDFMAPKHPCEFLRIRNNDDKEFSFEYHYCNDAGSENYHTEEMEVTVSDPEVLKKIMDSLNFKEVVTVDKTREVWDCGDFEVVLDFVKELGYFMEIEAKKDFGGIEKTKEACYNFLKELNIQHLGLSIKGYVSLLLEKQK